MSVSVAAMTCRGGLLLVGLGERQALAPLAAVAARLAAAESLPLLRVGEAEHPDASLAALAAADTADGGPGGPVWLAALPLDPGLPLERGGSWAEALGAWRQSCLLVVPAEQMATGLPAAGAALLERWRVPLVGLLQVGGEWEPLERRRDGLAWLGWLPGLPGDDGEALAALAPVLRRRWRVLQAA
jgi:hypothetical protein